MNPATSSDKLPRHLATGFVIALAVYVTFFSCDQRLRQRKGPWEVTFHTNSAGYAAITVNQRSLRLTNVQIVFRAETATNLGTVEFNKPQQAVPFGKVKFEDLTYLPGSVAFDFFGHEVELLPRILYLNKKEIAWKSEAVIALDASEKLPADASIDPRKKKRGPFSGSR
ncbi:MAG TPA: hypothetical protein VF773_04970 [Verrucomicrobiae bacterium]